MSNGNNYPDENRDRLANTNNSWTYEKYLGPGPIKAHIPAPTPEESDVDKAEVDESHLTTVAKKTAKAAKSAKKAEDANTAAESLAQK